MEENAPVEQHLVPACRGMLLLVRGISGAGKSTFAHAVQVSLGEGNVAIFENDQFRSRAGEYRFHPKDSKAIEQACLAAATAAMANGKPLVILANANTSWRSFSRYLRAAGELNYCVRQKVLRIDAETAHARNVHRVPLPIIRNELKNLENSLAAEQQRDASLPEWSVEEFSRLLAGT